MQVIKTKQRPIQLAKTGKREVRTQFGALCWRVEDGKVKVLLVTSRRTRRWIIPKGWPQHGATPAGAAEQEAWEEGGVRGKVRPVCLGIYSYGKDIRKGEVWPCVVAVFPMEVREEADRWPEKSQRKRKWVSLKKAASMVDEPELRSIFKAFDPVAA